MVKWFLDHTKVGLFHSTAMESLFASHKSRAQQLDVTTDENHKEDYRKW